MIELDCGARQRKIRGRIFEPASSSEQQMPTMAGNNSELSELRRRRGGHQAAKESMVADQERKQKQAPVLKVFNHAKSVIKVVAVAVAALHLLTCN